MLTQTDQRLVQTLKARLQKVADDRLKALIVYGSRVWGEAGPESDLDVVAIIQDCTPELEAALGEAAYQVMWDHDFMPLISLKIFDMERFSTLREAGFSFYRKVAQEGIMV